MMKYFLTFIIILILVSNLLAQKSKISWSSLNAGYIDWQSGNTNVKSLVGQSFVGFTKQSNVQVISGFLADTLIKSSTVGLNDEQEYLPKNYSLSQNYPNPFNPNTNIEYSVPNWSRTTLKVYDVLGSEIITLINEEKPAGVYKINWDASSLSSGVYFYRLQAGDPSTGSGQSFVETRKMILLK